MKVRIGVLVDFGNSETRMSLMVKDKVVTTVLSNKFAALPNGYGVSEEYKNDKSTVLCVNNMYYANGALADREFEGQIVRPSAVQGKSVQIVTELSLHLVLLTAIKQLALASGKDIKEIEPVVDISVLLPPIEHDMRVEQMEALVRGVKSVTSFLPNDFTAPIKIDKVKILPEGVAAFFGVYYKEEDNELVESEENLDYGEGNVIIFDIGAGTTDIVMIKDTELVLNSKETLSIGGNTVESNLKNLIRLHYGFTPNSVTDVVETGWLQDGSKKHDVAHLVTEAKEVYTKSLSKSIVEYLERVAISMREVKGILVVGGGSVPTVRDGVVVSPAMSEVLTKYLQTLSPNIGQMSTCGKNPRMLNIEGLQYIHKYA